MRPSIKKTDQDDGQGTVTKPFQSAYRLNKPYKPPFRTPLKEQENVLPAVPERSPTPPILIPPQRPELEEALDISDEATERACKCTLPLPKRPTYLT